ncbi:hydrolase [Aureococcus anophagefferens]|nr:hydrolase [Aureococcus anophagefferens]
MSSPSPKKRCPKPWRPLFAAGSRVECRHGGGDVFYPGVVTAVTSDGHYDVDYDDGDEERGVAGSLMRPEAGLKVGDALQKKFPGYGSGVFDGRVAEIFPAEKKVRVAWSDGEETFMTVAAVRKAMDHPPSPAKPVKRAAASAPPAPLPALEAAGGRPKRARKAPPALTYAKMGTNTSSAKKRAAWDSEEDASISSSDESAKPRRKRAAAAPKKKKQAKKADADDDASAGASSDSEDESSDDASSEDEKPKRKRKAAAAKKKAPAAKKKAAAAPGRPLTEAEKGTAGKPTAGLAPPMAGQYSGEYRFAIGTVVSVKCTSTGRWVRGHVIMHLRGGVTTFYAVEKVRCLFERMQGKNQHYEDVDVTTQKAAAACVVALDEPPREVRKWTSGTPCTRASNLEHAAAVKDAPFDPSLGFGASKLRTKQSTGKFSGGADAAAGLDEAEVKAKAHLAAGRVGEAQVLECLTCLGDKWPTQDRPNVTPDGKPVHGMCLGAVFVLGGVGMACSNVSEHYPELTTLVTKWVTTTLPEDFPFSSLQINYNYRPRPPRGGELWTADKFIVTTDEDGKPLVKGGGGPDTLDCKKEWMLFNGNEEHETRPYFAGKGAKPGTKGGTRISFIAFSHQAYNKLSTSVATRLKALGFTACSDDGVDLPYFTKYRIDKKEFDADENVKYFRYQRKRAIELPPPTKKNAVSVECYGLTMARGGGWMSHCDAAATRTVHELTPNMTGFHVLHLDASGAAGVALVESHVDKKRFNIYAKTDPETDRFAKFVKGLKPNAVVAVCITDTAVAAKRPPGKKLYDALVSLGAAENMEKIGYRFPFAFLGVKGAKPGSAVVLMDKTKFLLRIDATVVTAKDGTVTLADVAEEKTDITTKVILSKNHGDEG